MTEDTTTYFLIAFDNREHRQVSQERFKDSDEAVHAYDAKEDLYRSQPHIEVVLLGADSERAIRVTHSRYFGAGYDEIAMNPPEAFSQDVMDSILAPFKHLLAPN